MLAPLRLAEEWDNVGLLIGDRRARVSNVMTCLTVTPDVVCEAISRDVQLLITHHPLPFKPLTRITSDSLTGQMLLDLIAGRVAVYSAHTAFDSAAGGINATWAQQLNLRLIKPLELISAANDDRLGKGRSGTLEEPVEIGEFARRVAALVCADNARIVAVPGAFAKKVGIACGSGGSFVSAAKRAGCDTLLTGEATFHQCLEARACGISMILIGHFQSERFAMELLAKTLAGDCNGLNVFVSDRETDPLICFRS